MKINWLSPMRDPALLGAAFLAIIQVIDVLALHLTSEQLGLTNALAIAVIGIAVAASVRSDQWVPALLGLLKALGALVIGFGLHWTPEAQAAVMLAAVAVSALFTRTQVTAPVPAVIRPLAARFQP